MLSLIPINVVGEDLTSPTVSEDLVFAEKNGLVAVESEHFYKQTLTSTRAFHLSTSTQAPKVKPDADPSHADGASGGAYLEILPDTRATHGDKLVSGENFSNQPGRMAVLHYKVHFSTPGKYYVWARAYSTGTEDNGLHVGIDGRWPASGQRMQWTAKREWYWDSKQRTQKVHTGVPGLLYLIVEKPGEHEIMFSMREDGFEFDKWLMTTDADFRRPSDAGPAPMVASGTTPTGFVQTTAHGQETGHARDSSHDGDGNVLISGERKRWHKVTLTLDGPFAAEVDDGPNPFLDYRMTVNFRHDSGAPNYTIPGYFAADGNAAETSAKSGTKWRAHLSPDLAGKWTYRISFTRGRYAALNKDAHAEPVAPFDGVSGEFEVAPSEKRGRDFRAHGRLEYVGKHYLRTAQTKRYFLKAGADAPETLLGYADFDGTIASKPKQVPLKTWGPHARDWRPGDPTWQSGKGKGLIGAVNYLSGKGCNAFSFLTYNAGGDGDNVWPFVARDDKLHYDCSKLDQWGIVFDHATAKGMYLHYKLQETEMDDNRRGQGDKPGVVKESLDGGRLGPERKLYLRELVARFGHNLALNWNLGEENTQSIKEIQDTLRYLAEIDPYRHHVVMHTYPNQQDKQYRPLIGDKSTLTGVSLQNSHIRDTHRQALKWVRASAAAGKPWVVAFDESGSAAHGQCPDLGYQGYDGHDSDGRMTYTEHDVRRQTLWGTLMAGGAGVEYYFGYKYAENDLRCEDWRSRDRSWDYCRIALEFFRDNNVPFWQMTNRNDLVGNASNDNSRFCFASPGKLYLVYLSEGGAQELDLTDAPGVFTVQWLNPRSGGALLAGDTPRVEGGKRVSVGFPPAEKQEDWLVVVKKDR